MKKLTYIIALTFTVALLLSYQAHATVSNAFAIKVEIKKVTSLDKSASLADKLAAATLTSEPKLIAAFGKNAKIEIGIEQERMLSMDILPAQDGKTYDVSLLIKEKSEKGQWQQTNSQASSIKQDESVLFTTELNGTHYIITTHGKAFTAINDAKSWLN